MVYELLGVPVNDIVGDSFQSYGTKVADGLLVRVAGLLSSAAALSVSASFDSVPVRVPLTLLATA